MLVPNISFSFGGEFVLSVLSSRIMSNILESHTSTYAYVIQGSWLLNTESPPKFS